MARTYNWGGCYIGVNGGGAASGSDFTTTVGTGTHLTTADAALVVEGGTVGQQPEFPRRRPGRPHGYRAPLPHGLEGECRLLLQQLEFINGTATLSDGANQPSPSGSR